MARDIQGLHTKMNISANESTCTSRKDQGRFSQYLNGRPRLCIPLSTQRDIVIHAHYERLFRASLAQLHVIIHLGVHTV